MTNCPACSGKGFFVSTNRYRVFQISCGVCEGKGQLSPAKHKNYRAKQNQFRKNLYTKHTTQ